MEREARHLRKAFEFGRETGTRQENGANGRDTARKPRWMGGWVDGGGGHRRREQIATAARQIAPERELSATGRTRARERERGRALMQGSPSSSLWLQKAENVNFFSL